jgi:acetyltransferase-like isoleucine patch superfamily enzyme
LFEFLHEVSLVSFLNKVISVLQRRLANKLIQLQKDQLKRYGANFYMASYVVIVSPSEVEFGNNCAVNEFVHILGGGSVLFGNGVWIANHASIITVTHPSDVEFIGDHPLTLSSVNIEDNVWIGSHATILPGVRLGRSCIVGAGAVVTKDVPPYAVVAGVPAKIIRYKEIAPSALHHSKNQVVSPYVT